MKLLTKSIEKKLPPLYANEEKDPSEVKIVAKFFNPCGAGTWYATEASAILSDGREVSLVEADKIVRGLRCGDRKKAKQVQSSARADGLRPSHEMPQSARCQDEETGLLGHSRGEKSELGRRIDEVTGLHLRSDARASSGHEEWLCEESQPGHGAGDRPAPIAGRAGPPQEREQVRRFSAESGVDAPTEAPESARQQAATREGSLSVYVERVIFFGYAHITEGELGYFSLDELESLRLPFGLKIERDLHWDTTTTLKTVMDRGY